MQPNTSALFGPSGLTTYSSRLPHYTAIHQVTYRLSAPVTRADLLHNGSRKAPTYTVRVRCAFVFVVTQPDSLPFCPRHGGYYGKVRHHLFSTVLHRSNQTQVNCVTYCPGSLSRSLAIGSPKIPQCTRGPQQPCERKNRAFQITISKGRPEEQL
jgi:hypothetical protein